MSDTARWWALDLLLVVFLADLAGAAIYLGAPPVIRLPAALLLVLVLPGYALTAVFFPANNDHADRVPRLEDERGGLLNPLPGDYEVGAAERVVLSVTLSVAIVPAVAAFANFTPRGVTLEPILGGVLAVTVALAVVAFVRRLRLPRARRFRLSPGPLRAVLVPFAPRSRLHPAATRIGTYNAVAAVGLVLVASSVGYALAFPPTGEGFTEFYVVTDDATGNEPYPATFSTDEPRTVTLGIENREHREVRYTVVVVLADPSGAGGGAASANAAELGRGETTVPDGATHRLDVQVQPTRTGENLRLQFLLYRGDAPADPSTESAYRVLDLAVDVSGGGAAALEAPPH